MNYTHQAMRGLMTAAAGLFLLSLSTASVWGQQGAPTIQPGEDPAVAGILATDPTTPRERARAAKILADLGRPDLAKAYLKLLLSAKPDDAQLVAMAEEFGTPLFTGMAARDDLAPEAKQLADAVLAAVQRKARDPQRLNKFIDQLNDPSPDVRFEARNGLREARADAVGPLLAALVDPARADKQDAVRSVLASLGSDAQGPLVGVLESDNPKFVAQAIRTLGEMEARDAVIYLLVRYASEKSAAEVRAAAGAALLKLIGNVPTQVDAAALLSKYARDYFDGKIPLKTDLQEHVRFWSWDNKERHVAVRDLPAADASRAIAARLAREAYAVAPEDPQIRLLYLATMLEEAAYAAGRDNPLPEGAGTAVEKAEAFGPGTIEALLSYAIEAGHPAAATAAAQILGRTGKAETFLHHGAEPAPLVVATRHADRRLRMAALEAILRMQPESAYPGSSYIPEALGFFASTSGKRRVLLAGPSTESMMELVGFLTPLGYQVDTAISGREMIQKAIGSPDYEMILADSRLSGPLLDLAIQQLRRDGRTARLPVAILARDGELPRAKRVADDDPLSMAFSRPHTQQDANWQLEQLMGPVRGEMVPFAVRQKQAAQAIAWLAELAERDKKIYDTARMEATAIEALYMPELGAAAAAMLGELGTAQSQTALVEIASRWSQPLAVRQSAAKAFGNSVRRYGIMLRTDQVRRQYDRYNASADQDQETQKVLGTILDSIEAPSSTVAQANPDAEKTEKK